MAELINPLLKGLRGRVGELVFRNLNGKTVVSKYIAKQDKKKESLHQASNRHKFKEASARAKLLLDDPAMREFFNEEARRLKLPNAYTAAVRTALRS